MRLSFDPAKRDLTLAEWGLDFAAAAEIFAGRTYDREDDRFDYGEVCMITVGHMAGRMVVVVWTQRGDARHIISMRKANEREQARYTQFLA